MRDYLELSQAIPVKGALDQASPGRSASWLDARVSRAKINQAWLTSAEPLRLQIDPGAITTDCCLKSLHFEIACFAAIVSWNREVGQCALSLTSSKNRANWFQSLVLEAFFYSIVTRILQARTVNLRKVEGGCRKSRNKSIVCVCVWMSSFSVFANEGRSSESLSNLPQTPNPQEGNEMLALVSPICVSGGISIAFMSLWLSCYPM